MKKRVVGIYNSVEAAMLEIDKLKGLGHDESSIFLLTKDEASGTSIVQQKGIQLEEIPKEGQPEPTGSGVLSKLFYALDYETQHSGVASLLKSAGVSEDEVGTYVRKLERGDFVILADENAPHQPYSDESHNGYVTEDQAMPYYKAALNGEKRSVDALAASNGISVFDLKDNEMVKAPDKFAKPVPGVPFEDKPAARENIYAEHVYFDSDVPPIETEDEVLIRIPIVEDRAKVITEKVVTGEIVVRRKRG